MIPAEVLRAGDTTALREEHSVGQFRESPEERERIMEKVRIYFDREGNTLNVWFDDPKKEHVCEEYDS